MVGVDEAETRTKDRRNATQLANNGSMHSLSNNKAFKQDIQWYFRVAKTDGLWRVLLSRENSLWLEKFTRKICVSKICRWCNILIIRIMFVTVSAIKGPMTIFEITHREENNTAIYIKLRSTVFFVPPTLIEKHHGNVII